MSDLIAAFRRRSDRGDFSRGGGGSGVLTDRPPADQANLVWAWDPDLGAGGTLPALVGPTGTITTPIRSAGPPAFYTFVAADTITFGNSLDTTWTGTGWTIYCAINPSAADLIVPNSAVVCKDDGTSNREWQFRLATGQPLLLALYGNGATNLEASTANSAITAARHVITGTFNTTQAFGSRCLVYVDGASVAQGPTTAGVTGTISATTAVITQGQGPAATPADSVMSYIYAYKSVHSAATISQNYNWIHNTKGW